MQWACSSERQGRAGLQECATRGPHRRWREGRLSCAHAWKVGSRCAGGSVLKRATLIKLWSPDEGRATRNLDLLGPGAPDLLGGIEPG